MEFGVGLVDGCALGEGDEPIKLSVAALGTIIPFALFLVLALAFALND